MEKFISSIKKKYRERFLHRERQWPLCYSNKIINLLLVNRKAGEGYFGCQQRGKPVEEPKRNFIDYSKLFEAESGKKPIRKVLIEGDAGIGKTTFCLSLTEDWANGKIFQQFELLLFLPLRHRIVSSAGSLLELLKLLHSSTRGCESVATFLEEEEGEKVLIIADGWDELDKSGRQEGSFLYRLLFEELPFASVILTSRPSASSSLHCIDQFVEIHGFSRVRSLEYILSEFADDQDKARRLLKQIGATPFVDSICRIPLNCAIVCHLWRTNEEALPTTMTNLHTKMILNIVLHNLKKEEAYKDIKSLDDFNCLPNHLVESWWLLCEFAYRSMEADQIVFSRKKLASFFPQGLALDERILCFGLLQSAEPILETGYGVSFHFLHQIFQEYLVALHIMKQPLDKQLKIIDFNPNVSALDTDQMKLYCDKSTLENFNDGIKLFMYLFNRSLRFRSVWRFFCGIYFSESDVKAQKPNAECLAESLLTMIEKTLIILGPGEGWLQLCLLAFEARNVMVSQKVIQSLHKAFNELEELQQSIHISPSHAHFQKMKRDDSIVLGRPFLSAYDCAAIVYLVSNIQEPITIIMLNFSYSGIGDDSIRALADALASKNGEVQIKRISFEGNKLADKSIGDLFCRASVAFKSLHTLEISNNNISAKCLHSIATPMEVLSFRKLLTLDLSLNPLGVSGVKALDKIARSDALANLITLSLQGSLTDDAQINADLITTLALSCHQLCHINFSQNNLGLQGSVALTRIIFKTHSFISSMSSWLCANTSDEGAIHDARPVFEINASETKLDLIVFISYLDLEDQIHFGTMDLRNNGILGEDLLCLSHAIITYKISINDSLLLGDNPLGTKEAFIIGLMLSMCRYEFTTLDLSRCQLTKSEPSNDSSKLAIGQQLCQLPQTDILIDLTLDGNRFTGNGIYILAGFMHLCRCLRFLSCVNCDITSRDLLQLLDIVFGQHSPNSQCPCRELIKWYLDHNKIGDRGFAALLECLPSQFPKLGCGYFYPFAFDGNPVSSEMARRMNSEMERRFEVG